jgi:pyrroline-5-carboxylate reductase
LSINRLRRWWVYTLQFSEALWRHIRAVSYLDVNAGAGERAGLEVEFVIELAVDAMLGAAVLPADEHAPSELPERVTSRRGTTATALDEFARENELIAVVEDAVQEVARRSREL